MPAGFRTRVYAVVQCVATGAVTTYGDVAAVLGNPGLARQVGFALAALEPGRSDVPWHRVINSRGHISFRDDDFRGVEQRVRLENEGICFDAGGKVVDFQKLRYKYALHGGEAPDA